MLKLIIRTTVKYHTIKTFYPALVLVEQSNIADYIFFLYAVTDLNIASLVPPVTFYLSNFGKLIANKNVDAFQEYAQSRKVGKKNNV